MNLQDFLKLPPCHTISFEEGKELHRDIIKNMPLKLTDDQYIILKDYLESCIIHNAIEQDLVNKLELICKNINT